MFFEFDSKAIQAACKKASKKLNYKIVTLEDSNRINVESWWDKDPEYNYCVDIHSGTIVIEHFDENFENGIEESIGEFRCYYLYRYDPQGNYLDILDNADAISGDLCTAIGALKKAKEWKDVYDYSAGVLYIDRFYIKPDYRGIKLGHLIFPVLVDVFSKRKDTIVTIIPEPLHDMAKDLGREKSTLKESNEYKSALRKMQNFIKVFGFKQLGKGQVWAAAVMDKGIFT